MSKIPRDKVSRGIFDSNRGVREKERRRLRRGSGEDVREGSGEDVGEGSGGSREATGGGERERERAGTSRCCCCSVGQRELKVSAGAVVRGEG